MKKLASAIAVISLVTTASALAADPQTPTAVAARAYASDHGYKGAASLLDAMYSIETMGSPATAYSETLLWCGGSCGYRAIAAIEGGIEFANRLGQRFVLHPLPSHHYDQGDLLTHPHFRLVEMGEFRQLNGFKATLPVLQEID